MGNAADRPSRAEYGQATPGRRGWGGSPAGAEGEKAPSAPPAGGAGSGRLGDPVGSGPAGGGPRGAKGKRKSSSHKGKGHALIEVPRGIFSLLVNILMYALQQFMLLYVIISKTRSWLGLLFLIWDIPLLLYMCYSIKADTTADSCTSSRRCAVQWMTYTITVAVKMAAVAFVPSAYSDSSVALLNYTKNAVEAFGEMEAATQARHPPIAYFEEDMSVRTAGLANLVFSNNPHFVSQLVQVGESADNFLVYVGICLLPVIYVVFTARAKEAMYPTINQLVSVEGLLHADLGVALTLDMLDIVVMFRDSFSRYSNARWWGGDPVMKWICFAMVILTIVGVICLGFAFPTRSIDSRAITSLSQTDMFVSAKYAFLVGLFIVDIPFLALRIYWIVATDTISFFMFKNVYSLLTRPLRLNQCRLAEREKAKGTQKTFYDQDVLPEYREEEESEEAEEEEEETDDELQEEDEAMVPTCLPPGPSALGGSVSGPVPTSPALAQSPYYDPLYGNAPGQAPPHMGLPYGRGGPGPGAGGSLSGPGMPPHAGGSGGGEPGSEPPARTFAARRATTGPAGLEAEVLLSPKARAWREA
ncbi:hypothetical protein BESB_024990 [Besnoitia besnoiti]|uniref:Transmembrane protein n=1 Tax=Besnoitia besnoiti TaxID=94643 RepID=A0A2A9M797_BESBE|nr:uncharacterized protein BESB_024990 [Besnoitia besnoiti]PFH31533.1 hypothetical protein BESB_024990 [Besnoitia besnoiti]